jgi:hypothetical protein
MSIYFTKIRKNEKVFGALMVDLVKYYGTLRKDNTWFLVFETKKHGCVYIDLENLYKVRNRYIEHNISTKIIDDVVSSLDMPLYFSDIKEFYQKAKNSIKNNS